MTIKLLKYRETRYECVKRPINYQHLRNLSVAFYCNGLVEIIWLFSYLFGSTHGFSSNSVATTITILHNVHSFMKKNAYQLYKYIIILIIICILHIILYVKLSSAV